MNNTEEADNFFDQFIRDAISTEIAMPISEEDLEKQFDEFVKLMDAQNN